ncbi:MAG TPA: hypothetical protein V6C91_15365 [Coleofasciculaceae cyanobacterium]
MRTARCPTLAHLTFWQPLPYFSSFPLEYGEVSRIFRVLRQITETASEPGKRGTDFTWHCGNNFAVLAQHWSSGRDVSKREATTLLVRETTRSTLLRLSCADPLPC